MPSGLLHQPPTLGGFSTGSYWNGSPSKVFRLSTRRAPQSSEVRARAADRCAGGLGSGLLPADYAEQRIRDDANLQGLCERGSSRNWGFSRLSNGAAIQTRQQRHSFEYKTSVRRIPVKATIRQSRFTYSSCSQTPCQGGGLIHCSLLGLIH